MNHWSHGVTVLYDIEEPLHTLYYCMFLVFLAGLIARTFRTIFVEREEQDSKNKAVREIRKYASSKGEWPQLSSYLPRRYDERSWNYSPSLTNCVCTHTVGTFSWAEHVPK